MIQAFSLLLKHFLHCTGARGFKLSLHISKIDEGILFSLCEHQNLLFNKVDSKLPVVSTEDPVLIGFYVDDITLGLTVSVLTDACLDQSGLRI